MDCWQEKSSNSNFAKVERSEATGFEAEQAT
jgi:hypothetical protein